MADKKGNSDQQPSDDPVVVESDLPKPEPFVMPDDPVAALRLGWRDAWQIPALLVGAGMLMLGIAYSISTSADPDMSPVISQANHLIEVEDYEQAIELLNTEVYPWVSKPETPKADKVLYHLAKARSIYRGQLKLDLDDQRNHVSVIREYLEAERLGGTLTPSDQASIADTYIKRDEIDLSLQRAREIPESKRYLRDAVYKKAVRSMLDRPVPMIEDGMDLLADMLIDPNLPVEDRVWALETQGDIRLTQGFADETITRILRAMPRLERAGVGDRSRLHLILAKAYNTVGAPKQATEQVEHAKTLSAEGDPHYPEILLIEGIIEDSKGNTSLANDRYNKIVNSHSNSTAYPLALLGVGETEAALNETELSFDAFSKLVELYDSFGIESYPSRKQILDSLIARSGDSLSIGAPSDAIQYANLADQLYSRQEIPTEVLSSLAMGHQVAAESLLGKPIEEVRSLIGLDPSTRAEVQRHLISAASNYSMHADRHVIANLPVFADSLWRSADLFDRAGDQPEAIQAFKNYADSMPSDPRHAEAMFRLAESLRALGDFKAAADVYKGLIEAREGNAGADIGPFADASHVPLAQAYLYDEDPTNDAEAEKLLASSLDGSMGSSETAIFRDALLELAGLYDRTDRPERAIERYDEFAARYPDDPEAGSVLFKLADAHRRLSDIIEDSLIEAMPAAEQNRRLGKITKHRREAVDQYKKTIDTLGTRSESELGLFESISLRNSYFYLGDCAFDLGDYAGAIQYYDQARDHYVNDPASLVAMVQIVNAYIATGEIGRARTANDRARRFYESLPESVWDDPRLPMDRRDWERWLNSSAILLAQSN
ncbi:MAG: tetratricopeptide repeat protein [Phycisphaerales bacterium]|nr:tetratricopeptide repeat protein [Phycisphaerales bacterium]